MQSLKEKQYRVGGGEPRGFGGWVWGSKGVDSVQAYFGV
jgi:hypothetical protein